jgi:diguanylate cyclase (GGDEF)-like protein
MLQLIETQLVSLAVLITIFFSIKRSKSRRFILNRIFNFLVLSNFLILIFDAISLLVDGKTDTISRMLLPLSIFLYYFMHPIIIVIWTFYVDYHIFASEKRFKYLALSLAPFVLVNTVFSVMSFFGNYMFYIDSNNVYMRGNMFYVVVFTSYLLMFFTMGHLIINRGLIRKSDFKALFFFPFPPLLIAVYQILNSNIQLIWPFMTISVLIVYITVQSRITATDPLTGVFNRREYEYQVEQRSKLMSVGKKIGGIMIDVNDLKLINDNYMHHAGDMALIKLAEILKNSIRKDDFVARIGGDEFVIIFDANDQSILQHIVKRIKENLEIFNSEQAQKYELSISIGYGIYDQTKFATFHDFIQELDKRMYQSKHEMKSNL